MRAAAWSTLFAQANPQELLAALARELGFGETGVADAATCRALGIAEDVASVLIAPGPGATRLLLVVGRSDRDGREQAGRLADRLSKKAPHLLWLLALIAPQRREVVVATWHPGIRAPRVAALVVDCCKTLPSDIDTMTALAASLEEPGLEEPRLGGIDLEVHGRWIEILGREAISRRFFQALQGLVIRLSEGASGKASPTTRRDMALLYVSRLLFLAFLEGKGWLDADRRFLARTFDECVARGGGYQRRVLEPLFFGTLNTPPRRRAPFARSLGRIPFLNGGLFTRAAAERSARDLVMRDEDFGETYDQLLTRYRFTPREETSTWQEAAIDPEILGRSFESLMAAADRRVTGAFYTPLPIVARATDAALEAMLARGGLAPGIMDRVAGGGALEASDAAALRNVVAGVRVLDPACGSGAFLVHVVDRLTHLRVAAGDVRPLSTVRREVLSQSIFGVDVNPTAVWLCELRLWLSLVIDHPATDPSAVPPLPNLDHNIRCGDTLAGGDFSLAAGSARDVRASAPRAALLRARYSRATGARKQSLGRALDRAERARLVEWLGARVQQIAARRRSLVGAARGRDLFGGRRGAVAGEREEARQLRLTSRELRARRRAVMAGSALPFAFTAQFPDAARAGGFDVIVGNPPWIRLHHIPASMRDGLRREFRVYREAAWLSGARAARAGSGFGSQVDAASLFVERSHQLLKDDGVMSLLVPSKLWRSLAGGGVRRLVAERSTLLALEDWSGAPALFDAATYPSMIVATRSAPGTADSLRLTVHRGRMEVAWQAPRSSLPLDESAGAPWIALPPEARAAFDRLTREGVPLSESGLGVATLGVKCGCNDAYLVNAGAHPGGVEVSDGSRTALLEPRYVRPVLRGESVRAWAAGDHSQYIVFPYRDDGRTLERLPLSLKAWLQPWRARLASRADARGHGAWWSLFRLEGSRHDRPRVVWADLGRTLQALVLNAGDRMVPLNTCYVLPTRDLVDALAVAALLNSPIADAWVGAVAEPARGGYRRHFAWTMARLPVPDDWARARDILAPLGDRGLRGDPPGRVELMDAALDAFRIRRRTIAPLLEWMNV